MTSSCFNCTHFSSDDLEMVLEEEEEDEEDGYGYNFNYRVPILAGLVVISLIGNTAALCRLFFGLESTQGARLWHRKGSLVFLNLIIADFLVTAFSMAGQCLWEATGWIGGNSYCKFLKFMQTFSLTLSNYMLVTIAIERHRAVSNPLHHSGASYRMLITTWVSSALISFPSIFIFSINKSQVRDH
ncbi:gonadotropin-releasing hormone receptor [Eurytemora carolleeae]|uniref:gonadotropin-releasing hormone receptor n=1 Tax=Eurytemora carolleeae TaxID=1294199 RepID=UPI000C77DFB9|nr:gonadotropin-releasing hormone receptor [Eurytemora carolleeae]|eukprot:XP_023329339.1 gonadotropin-releasing hormone receptor-like [Eurytemora affinis]